MHHFLLGIHCIVMSQSRNEYLSQSQTHKCNGRTCSTKGSHSSYTSMLYIHAIVSTPRMLAPIPAANFESKHRCLLSRFYGISTACACRENNSTLCGLLTLRSVDCSYLQRNATATAKMEMSHQKLGRGIWSVRDRKTSSTTSYGWHNNHPV